MEPDICSDNRTNIYSFNESCGFHSETGICNISNSACMTAPDNLWSCKCTTGHIQRGNECIKVPNTVIPESNRQAEVELKVHKDVVNVVEVYSFNFTGLDGLRILNHSCISSIPERYTCSSTTSGIKINTKGNEILNSEEYYVNLSVMVFVTMENNVIDDTANVEIYYRKPRINITNVISSETKSGQILAYVPARTKYPLLVTISGFSINDERDLVLTTDVKNLIPSTTLCHPIYMTVWEETPSENLVISYVEIIVVRNLYETSIQEFDYSDSIKVLAILGPTDSFSYSIVGSFSSYFAIKKSNLNLISNLDYENPQHRLISVTVNISRESIHIGDCEIIVNLTDADDNEPRFASMNDTVVIVRSALSAFITNLHGLDNDSVGTLSYTVLEGDTDFEIRNSTELWKLSALENSSVVVGVSDSIHLVRKTIRVIIEAPSEENVNKTFNRTMVEELPIGTTVFWVNDTNYENYRFIDNKAARYFRVDNNTGEIVTAGKIDRDTDIYLINHEYMLDFHIRVNKKGFPCSFVILGRLVVEIQDINDNPPEFNKVSYSGTIKENVTHGTPVMLSSILRVTDKDSTGIHKYSSSNPVFTVTRTGESLSILTSGDIDRETIPSYIIVITASDGNRSVHVNVTITVEDINDNMPVFQSTTTSFSVSEDTEVHSPISKLSFTDIDTGLNSKLTYHVNSGYFAVNESGFLMVDVPLDRETIARHEVVLTVCDQGTQPLCTKQNLSITVTDANDNSPVYDNYTGILRINESIPCGPSSTFASVLFSDPDIGNNSRLIYSLTGRKTNFDINGTTGSLFCINSLNYDNTTEHRTAIQVQACDKGIIPRCSENITLYIDVTDVNDNAPTFIGDFKDKIVEIKIDINDFSRSFPVKLVSATDLDSGENAKLVFRIDPISSNGSRYLNISHTTGLVSTTSQSGIERDKNYSLVVVVTDKGDVPLSSTATIIFSAIESNKNFSFNVSTLGKSIPEDSSNSTVIVTMSNFLRKGNKDVQIIYDMPGQSHTDFPFSINSSNGLISLTKGLNRETTNGYIFVVRANAGGANALVLVTIEVLDINDNSPELSRDRTSFTHQESQPINSSIGRLTAVDSDEGDNAITVYRTKNITIDYCASSYGINETTGHLYLKRVVDFDALHQNNRSTYCYLAIEAVDRNKKEFKDSVNITIEVLDDNDNRPEFVGSNDAVQVSEDRTPTDAITLPFIVTDKDRHKSRNSHIEVSMTSGIHCPFNIISKELGGNNRSLVLTLQQGQVLDYEMLRWYSCNITAIDKGRPALSNSIEFNVTVTDVNDNAPIVTDDISVLNISRYTPLGSVILMEINATDSDSGMNGELRFLKGDAANPWTYFQLNESTGTLTVNKRLSDLSLDNVSLSVNISDRGTQPLTTITQIFIMIQDDNVRPFFNITRRTITVIEGRVSTNTSLFDEPTIAYDEGAKSGECDCIYSLRSTSLSDKFWINQSTAQISLLEGVTLDREEVHIIELQVVGEDNGIPRKETEPPLVINVIIQDVNDNPPTFDQSRYEINIFQEYPVDKNFQDNFTVSDRDEIVSVYMYSITNFSTSEDVSDNFTETVIKINQSGKLSLTRSVDLGLLNDFFFEVTIRVEDKEKPTFYDTASVRINVTYDDPNKSPPRFVDEPYRTSLDLNKVQPIPGYNRVFDVKAVDNDTGDNGVLIYSIVRGNIRDTFSIHPSNGTITLQHPVDGAIYNQTDPKRINLTVMVMDQGIIPKSSTTNVSITPVGSPQQCDSSSHGNSVVNQQKDAITPEDTRYFIAMFGLIGVTCLLLVTNSIFIILFCRTSPIEQSMTLEPPRKKVLRYNFKTFRGTEYESGASMFRFNNWSQPASNYSGLSNIQRQERFHNVLPDDALDFGNNGNLDIFQKPDLPPRNYDQQLPLPTQETRDPIQSRDVRPSQFTDRRADRPDDMYVTPLPEPPIDYPLEEEEEGRFKFIGRPQRAPSDFMSAYSYKSSFT